MNNAVGKKQKTLWLLLRTIRPAQWAKNLFVAAPALFAREHTLQDPFLLLWALLGTILFTLLSGAVYIFNDWLDAPRDRLHPEKRLRPLASGALSAKTALITAIFLTLIALLGSAFLGSLFLATSVAYFLLNAAYTVALKKIAYLDIIVIATGFLLRIVAGCFAIGLSVSEISYFLIICTFLVALFLAIGKRRAEMEIANGPEVRPSLKAYNKGHLTATMWATAALAVLTYAVYTVAPRTVAYFGTHRLVWTVPFVVGGFLRFFSLTKKVRPGQSPTDLMVRDPIFVINILVWAAVAAWAIYGGHV